MSILKSLYSTTKTQSLGKNNLPKISSKAISKSKSQIKEMVELVQASSNLAQLKVNQWNKKQYLIAQIVRKNIMNPSNDETIKLGKLLIDEIAEEYKVLERRIEQENIECKLQISNFHVENTGLMKVRQLSTGNHILQFYKYLPQETFPLTDRKKFEENLSLPYQCVQIKYEDQQIIGLSKRMNYDFIRIMGINLDIINDYISKQDQIPQGLYHNSLVWNDKEKRFIGQFINYQGENFQVKIEFKKFQQESKQNHLNEYLIYMIVHCDRKYLNVQNIEKNYMDYYNLKNISYEEQSLIYKPRILKECIVKPIIKKLSS